MAPTILLIDDNAPERALTRKLLELEGYAVEETARRGWRPSARRSPPSCSAT
jgi:CheY-like chemotaxis protein